jgi:hypothetical protein
MRQVIINLETEHNHSKKDEFLKMLENMGIEYQTSERQTLEEYNQEIDEAIDDFEKGNFIPVDQLKEQSKSW